MTASARVADCDLWLYELHLRMNKLEESKKILTAELAEKEQVIKNLESEVEKIKKVTAQQQQFKEEAGHHFSKREILAKNDRARHDTHGENKGRIKGINGKGK